MGKKQQKNIYNFPKRKRDGVKHTTQDYGNSALEPAWCISGGLNATRNNDQLRCRLRNSKEAPKGIAKQTARYAVKRCFAPPR
ncbi:hypothetical protein TNCV_2012101 [Trichonephila clavipes]|nr:hypothetical protein TNCV_2012101 [Trichonephila clavipes]